MVESARLGPRAFTRIELIVVVIVVGVAGVLAAGFLAILMPALAEARRQGGMIQSMSNLSQFSVATNAYGMDHQDMIWTFSWKAGTNLPSKHPDLQSAPTDMDAAANQAVDILRRRGSRPDIGPIQDWMPHAAYSHLVIMDYLAMPLPQKFVADPADTHRHTWMGGTAGFDSGMWLPHQPAPSADSKPWPYSSSWQLVPAAYDRSPEGSRIEQDRADAEAYKSFPGTVPGGGLMADAAYPSQKVMLHDTEDRHFAKTYYADPGARVMVLLFDGSVKALATSSANPGWQPNNPGGGPTTSVFTPRPWEAGTGPLNVTGYYRWTRSGLRGVDLGGPEVTQP